MAPQWKSFLLFRLPIAAIVLAVLVEGMASLLSGVPRLRHPMDARAIEVLQPGPESAILLFGDSVTQDVAKTFDLGPVSRVRDVTANKASGVMGVYLLMRRYLTANPAPRTFAFAITPEFAGYVPDQATAGIYLTSVFESAEEQAILAEFGLQDEGASWRPAILSPDAAVFDRAVALASGVETPARGSQTPLQVRPEDDTGESSDTVSEEQVLTRRDFTPTVEQGAKKAWAAICRLAAAERIDIAVRWAPVPWTVWDAWLTNGVIDGLSADIRAAGDGACADVQFGEFNSREAYPDTAFRDPDHLRRPDWTGWYANALSSWIVGLEGQENGG